MTGTPDGKDDPFYIEPMPAIDTVAQPHLEITADAVTWAPPVHAIMDLRIDPADVARFLGHLSVHGNITAACKHARIGRTTIWRLRQDHAEFDEAIANAMEAARDCIDSEVHRRGAIGVIRPVFQGGRQVGQVREFSDKMLELRAKALDPRYRQTVGKVDINTMAVAGAAVSVGPPMPPVNRTDDTPDHVLTLGESIAKLAEIAAAHNILPESMEVSVDRDDDVPPSPDDVEYLNGPGESEDDAQH